MKKEVLKEFDKPILLFDILLYSVYVLIGFVLLNLADLGLNNPFIYSPYIFYTFAFFSILAYFINRRRNDYEYLLFGFINVLVATFILVYMNYPDSGFILADAVLLYSIANVLNKGFSCNRLLKEKDVNFFSKVSITILLLFLGVFVVSSLYNKLEVGTLILGYYFVTFGLLSLLEPFIAILMNNQRIKKHILNLLSYDIPETKKDFTKEEKQERKEKVTIKNRTIKKIKKK